MDTGTLASLGWGRCGPVKAICRLVLLVAAIATICGCTSSGTAKFERQYGKAEPRERIVENLSAETVDYWDQVKPIIANRCAVCHGCYDAPCQLKLTSIEGIERGASSERIYKYMRLNAAPTTRLFEDAHSVEEWREKGFYPVLNEFGPSPAADREAGTIYRMLRMKQQNPLPAVKHLPKTFDLSLDRKESCVTTEKFARFEKKHPLWGMPFALPGLPPEEQALLMQWIEQGAVYTKRPSLPQPLTEQVEHWEEFLNRSSLKQQLAARYIYEHLSYAHLYFPEVDELRFFTLVRSSTPPGEPVKSIATRRPFNDPGVDRVYYRLQEVVSTIVEKTHMPYILNERRMRRWQSLFIDAEYSVTELPSYEAESASNPFRAFADIPTSSRYKFMLDEAQFSIMLFIKGPVCRGDVALNVIRDNFWIFFVDPDNPRTALAGDALMAEAQRLDLPASKENIYRPVTRWHEHRNQQAEFLAKKDQLLTEYLGGSDDINLDLVWAGDGVNQNASLSIYRHFDNATVAKGLLGKSPKTAWLMGYSLLERIHYLLVAGYDVYGNLGHQLDTRLYMSFLRMEAEANFLLLLPEDARIRERDDWYRGAHDKIKAFVANPMFENYSKPGIPYRTDDQKGELYELLKDRLSGVLPVKHTMSIIENAQTRQELDRLNRLVGTPVNLLPQTAFLLIAGNSGDEYVTLLRNDAYTNMATVFKSQKNRLPEDDTLTAIPGLLGAYPRAFYRVEAQDLSSFVDAVSGLETESDYTRLMDDYGIRRTDTNFWEFSDRLHSAFRNMDPVTYGMFDYNRLENR
jgi:hypothetical protein